MPRALFRRAATLAFAVALAACANQSPNKDASVEQVEPKPPVHSFAPDGTRKRTDDLATFNYPRQFMVSQDAGPEFVTYDFVFGSASNVVIRTEYTYFWRIGKCSLKVFDTPNPSLTAKDDELSLVIHLAKTLPGENTIPSGEAFTPEDPPPPTVTARFSIPYTTKLPESLKSVLGADSMARTYDMFATGQIIDLGDKRGLAVCNVWAEHQYSAMRLLDRLGETLSITDETKRRSLPDPTGHFIPWNLQG